MTMTMTMTIIIIIKNNYNFIVLKWNFKKPYIRLKQFPKQRFSKKLIEVYD